MNPSLVIIQGKNFIGKRISMSLANNRVPDLWKSFLPHIALIPGRTNPKELVSLAVYPPDYFDALNPDRLFDRWAAVEVESLENIPELFESLYVQGGLYAVFAYKGSSADTQIFKYIYGEWLPNSGYQLDLRPHFEILGEKYKNNDPESEEEIWIPLKSKEN